jgi:hypothetical protein
MSTGSIMEKDLELFDKVFAKISVNRLRDHIQALEGTRHPEADPAALEKAADYIWNTLASLGYEMDEHHFYENGRRYRNVIATRKGVLLPNERVLVMAHYDTVDNTPGADDNASGVALMLELAAVLNQGRLARSLQFVGVSLEENREADDPASGTRGSRALAQFARENKWDIKGVIVLESVAYAGDAVLQSAPPGLPIEVSEVGNFIAVIGNEDSIGMVLGFAQVVDRHQVPLPYLILAVPANGETIADCRRSDHAPFWDQGYRAILVTDTTNFRSPHYHQPTDTLATLNLTFAAEVCRATGGLVLDLAGTALAETEPAGLSDLGGLAPCVKTGDP